MIVLVAIGAAVIFFSAVIAIALGRAAAYADRDMELQRREELARRERRSRISYAGWSRAQSAIARDPSTTVPSSSTRVGTQRFPVSS